MELYEFGTPAHVHGKYEQFAYSIRLFGIHQFLFALGYFIADSL